MPYKGPHISIDMESLVGRVLRISHEEFSEWPESVRELCKEIAGELFLVSYNPFIDPSIVRESAQARFEQSKLALAHHYATTIGEGITMFWSAFEADMAFREDIIRRLESILPRDRIDLRPQARVESSTDATDLRMELPLLVINPTSAEEVSAVVKLANEMSFALVPRGGASGLTGGAVPARKRSVVMSLTRLNAIREVNTAEKTITVEAGVITNDALEAAAEKDLLFSVDPASKTASTIGGNIAENSGGPLCFEYGTTIDNILSFRMVTPTGEIIDIVRMNHPRHKIMEHECAIFEVRDISGGVRKVVTLQGSELRAPGLGKDVTNKALGGLPGLQKEGVDGIIIDAKFILHSFPEHKRVMVLEFFGRTMVHAMKVIKEVVALRDAGRAHGDLVKITALEEFGNKYVQAIEYRKKSTRHEGDPISVLILQLESDDDDALSEAVHGIERICAEHEQVEAFVAKDAREEELFWEDRHKLSAIAKRTSGFKVNEDVVIPIDAVPDFAVFIEQLNLECTARSYRSALQAVGRIQDFPEEEKEFNREFMAVTRIIKGDVPASELSDQELELRAVLFLGSLRERYPALAPKIAPIEAYMIESRIMVANHMHAGDGNCHVNIPVNSNDPVMLHNAESTAMRVMRKAQEVGGEVSGEHGIGITKISFLSPEKMEAIREVKRLSDPRNIMNPAKLTQKELPVKPFTFSFNRLIRDIDQSGIEDKERLISLLAGVQICTRCGKCKQVCAMHCPESRLSYQPRNKNMTLGSLIEAIYYTRINKGITDPALVRTLRSIMEHCTACGKCTAVCPVKIKSADVALTSRVIAEREKQGGHPIKSRVLGYLAADTARRLPKAAKMASTGQRMANRFLGAVPASLRGRISNPLFAGPGPRIGYRHLMEVARLDKGGLFVPTGEVKGTVIYFPGCGASMFYRSVALGGITLLLRAGYAVMLPEEHLCCGFPLLAAGLYDACATTRERNRNALAAMAAHGASLGYAPTHILTACGSCRDGLERTLPEKGLAIPDREERLALQDILQFLHEKQPKIPGLADKQLLYHSPCHAEWSGVDKRKAPRRYAAAISECSDAAVTISSGCCGESGMGAMTSPAIYNRIRKKKSDTLQKELARLEASAPVIVSCPSCKMGITRILMPLGDKRPVLHSLEFLAESCAGPEWRKKFPKLLAQSAKNGKNTPRIIDLSALGSVVLTQSDVDEDEDDA
ncbi:FAD-binding oxidoreductase [Desulfovibrio sp. OttesenSCG-928-I05]|nr:FAD-binding oxidoreductase [Desulfovibrio sp. OttesenSCG-928-I05]